MSSRNFFESPDIKNRVINPLVKRHAEDAAFYWMQRNGNVQSPILNFQRFKHFDRLLNAHLDGLLIADEDGWKIALSNLQRWRTNGEAFVAYFLAFSHDHERPQQLWNIVSKLPDTTHDGLVSALGWLAEEKALPWLEEWLQREDMPLMQSLALRAYSIRRLLPSISLEPFFSSPHARVRAAALTLAGRMRLDIALPYLPTACKAEDLTERASAIIALQLLGNHEEILSPLWHTVSLHQKAIEENKGLTQLIARRRTETLARHLGHAIPVGHAGLLNALSQLPARLALIVMAHHGDPVLIPRIIEAMKDKAVARLAGWAFAMIVGIDLDAEQLTTLPNQEDEVDELTTPIEDPDAGLPIPHEDAISHWWEVHKNLYKDKGKLLFGHSVNDKANCVSILQYGTQTARFAAALHLALNNQAMPYLETRAYALLQEKLIAKINSPD